MSAVVIEETVRIPERISGHESFRRWARSEAFPQEGRISFLAQEVWVDMSPEDLLEDNQPKGQICSVLTLLTNESRGGLFFHDRSLLTNTKAGLSTEPDGLFASRETLKARRLRFVKRKKIPIEAVGTPDMTLEVVSSSSERKDKVVLRRLYWLAGVREYWLVDARDGKLDFEILRWTKAGFAATPARRGWRKSEVFGKSFRLRRGTDELGYAEFTLDAK